jgi:hypothetical protein
MVSGWVLPELVEAAARMSDDALARDALERLTETTEAAGNDVALGIEARCEALLREGEAAENLYLEAITRLRRTPLRPTLARAYLLYGEWLRRAGRRLDAREQLRIAHDMFVAIGMDAFAERTRRELVATGERLRKRGPTTRDELTPQEEQIARLARDGLSNPEIGAALPQPAHDRMAPAQRVHEARHQLSTRAPHSAGRERPGRPGACRHFGG